MADKFAQLEQNLEMLIENIRQISIIVTDFQPQGQAVLNQKIQATITGLQDIDKLRAGIGDVKFPLEVFDYIDQGTNPQLYTKDCMEKALNRNEDMKGKIEAFETFKNRLVDELTQVFPNEMAKYKDMRCDVDD